VDGTRTRDQKADESLLNKLNRDRKGKVESSRLETVRDHSRPVETVRGTEPAPTEAELERGILDAIKLGALDLARALSVRLARRLASERP
jgi:citrate lyase beta subunit